MRYRYRAARTFWRSFNKLSLDQQTAARRVFGIFKANPIDPRLRPHKIQRLSAQYGRTIHAVDIQGDLRATFYLDGDAVWSVDLVDVLNGDAKLHLAR